MRISTLVISAVLVSLAACGSSEQLPDAFGVEAGPVSGSGNADWACEQEGDGLWTCRARDGQRDGEVQ